ncbi:MAG: alpha/beta hydrolase [Gammaproteobacteria bacterium]|nr:MAG: alpha/beta hydrolase [Gammaproteobacteria bacterium]RLA60587.1 MAG: alpha/beta hydrolase [Gammaproteobacteria bacterium]
MKTYEDIWYQSSDGLRLYARDYSCRDPIDIPGTPILCMHGLTRNSADFSSLAQHLSNSHRVISVDQRGRGNSEYDSVIANYKPMTYVRDMFTLLDTLELERVILIGTSMGGLMSFFMCAKQPQRISAMVINDIGPEVDPVGLNRIKSFVGNAEPVTTWAEAVAQARTINEATCPDFNDQQWSDFARALYKDVDGVPVLAYDPAIAQPMGSAEPGAAPPDLWPVFEACAGTPMLVIRGAISDILAPECMAQMHLRKADLQSVEVPRCGHPPTLDEPQSRTAIDQFLGGL